MVLPSWSWPVQHWSLPVLTLGSFRGKSRPSCLVLHACSGGALHISNLCLSVCSDTGCCMWYKLKHIGPIAVRADRVRGVPGDARARRARRLLPAVPGARAGAFQPDGADSGEDAARGDRGRRRRHGHPGRHLPDRRARRQCAWRCVCPAVLCSPKVTPCPHACIMSPE